MTTPSAMPGVTGPYPQPPYGQPPQPATGPYPQPPYGQPPQPPKKRRTGLIVLLVILAVMLIGIVGCAALIGPAGKAITEGTTARIAVTASRGRQKFDSRPRGETR